MSFDFKLAHVCPHLVLNETEQLNADLQTLVPQQPLASTQVRLMINGYIVTNPSDSYSGFTIVSAPNYNTRILKLRRPRDFIDDLFQLSYYTSAVNCRRCGGLRAENDLQFTSAGLLVRVTDEDLLIQEVTKIVTTILGSNIFHLWYGTQIFALIGSKISSFGYVQSNIQAQVQQAMANLLSIQGQQAQYQTLTSDEQLARTISISVVQSAVDPTGFDVTVTFQNKTNVILSSQTTFTLPGPAYKLQAVANTTPGLLGS